MANLVLLRQKTPASGAASAQWYDCGRGAEFRVQRTGKLTHPARHIGRALWSASTTAGPTFSCHCHHRKARMPSLRIRLPLPTTVEPTWRLPPLSCQGARHLGLLLWPVPDSMPLALPASFAPTPLPPSRVAHLPIIIEGTNFEKNFPYWLPTKVAQIPAAATANRSHLHWSTPAASMPIEKPDIKVDVTVARRRLNAVSVARQKARTAFITQLITQNVKTPPATNIQPEPPKKLTFCGLDCRPKMKPTTIANREIVKTQMELDRILQVDIIRPP